MKRIPANKSAAALALAAAAAAGVGLFLWGRQRELGRERDESALEEAEAHPS